MLSKGAPQSEALGQLGSAFIADTAAHTGLNVGIIYCITACTFTTLTSGNNPAGTALMTGTLANITLSPGMVLYGYFTTITLASGSIIAYNVQLVMLTLGLTLTLNLTVITQMGVNVSSPPSFLLDEGGNPILDESGNRILLES